MESHNRESLINSFDKTVLAEYFTSISCYDCGSNNPSDWHHILGRGWSKGVRTKIFSSPLNASPLCRDCHSEDKRSQNGRCPLSDKALRATLLQRTINHLIKNGYTLTDNDRAFRDKFQRYYFSPIHKDRAHQQIRRPDAIGRPNATPGGHGLPARMGEDT